MIGADEITLDNAFGSTIIVRRGPNAREEVEAYRRKLEELGIPLDLPGEEIRRRVWNSERANRSPLPQKREGEFLRCPRCKASAWHIGRSTATCAREACGYVLELDRGVDVPLEEAPDASQ